MKKRLLIMLLFGAMLLSFTTGCSNNINEEEVDDMQQENIVDDTQQDRAEIYKCLEKELESYIVSEKEDLIEIPLSEIKESDNEKIEYYKGAYSSEYPDNMYVMVYPKNGTYDYYVMKDFDKYFYEKFSVYQTSETTSSPSIYIHTDNNDIDFEDVLNKCIIRSNSNNGKTIPTKKLDKINDTKKIVIKSDNKKIGTITDNDKLRNILNVISNSKQYGSTFLCDGYAFEFKMYGKNNKLIDTIYVWYDGKRILPASISGGCSYYSVPEYADIRKIIEEETDYVFYGMLDFRDDDNQKSQLIYKDDKHSYYIKSENTNEILIKFRLNNKTMTLKYALENNYISAEKVAKEHPNILVKK